MSEHTPGPWYADKEGYIYRRPLIAGDKPLAAAWKGWYEEGQIGYPVKANARLIAAAPEMYELIQALAVGYDEDDGQGIYQRIDDFIDFTHQAQSLLAKIEGRETTNETL